MTRRTTLRLAMLSAVGTVLAACGSDKKPLADVVTGTWDVQVLRSFNDIGKPVTTGRFEHYVAGTVTMAADRFHVNVTGSESGEDVAGSWAMSGRAITGTLENDKNGGQWRSFRFAGADASVADPYSGGGTWTVKGEQTGVDKLALHFTGKRLQIDYPRSDGAGRVRTIATKR